MKYNFAFSQHMHTHHSSTQVVDGCVCINPGHLTKKATSGTFAKLAIPELPAEPDLTSEIEVYVVHI